MATSDLAAERGSPVRNALLAIPAAYHSTVEVARRKPLGAVGGVTALILIIVAIASRLAVLPVPDPYASVGDIFLAPSREFPMGTDVIGRDILARVLHGTWISLVRRPGQCPDRDNCGLRAGHHQHLRGRLR